MRVLNSIHYGIHILGKLRIISMSILMGKRFSYIFVKIITTFYKIINLLIFIVGRHTHALFKHFNILRPVLLGHSRQKVLTRQQELRHRVTILLSKTRNTITHLTKHTLTFLTLSSLQLRCKAVKSLT